MSHQWRRPRSRDLSSIQKANGSESFKKEKKVNSVKQRRKQILRAKRRPRRRDLSSIRKAKGSESFKEERGVNSVKQRRKQILRAKRRVLELLIQSLAMSEA